MVSHQNYDEKTKAVQSVLMELMETLSPYWKHLVVVGGSVPDILFPDPADPHIGTLDVDLGLTVKSPELRRWQHWKPDSPRKATAKVNQGPAYLRGRFITRGKNTRLKLIC
jgi:hypothetical protein